MPLTKSAKKALSVAKRRKLENDLVRARIKSAVKGVRLGVKNNAGDSAEKLTLAYRKLDIAAKKKVIHKNKAARLKSRLTKALASGNITTAVKKKKAAKTSKAKIAKRAK
jgi:small subunit ribosomal protein S20